MEKVKEQLWELVSLEIESALRQLEYVPEAI
jgi:hypothetical protein